MKHFVAIENHTKEELDKLIKKAQYYKKHPTDNVMKGKSIVTMFFNPSTRTKTSFDIAAYQLGGHAVCIEPGKSSWGIEIEEGTVMEGDAEEHLKDATKVLCRYADLLAVRCFPKFVNWKEEKEDPVIKSMVKWSSKPVINMETITHPCQALAMMMAIKEKWKNPKKKKFVLTWAYHPKPLNTAVANSAGTIASMFGMDITIAHPKGYDLDPYYVDFMKKQCKKNGAKFEIVNDMEKAMEDADFVYAKSWGKLSEYGNFNMAEHAKNKKWIVDEKKMALTNNGYFSHCLPLRRNVKATDGVLDSNNSLIYDEAENRLHVQKAIMAKLLEDN
jgi:N-acetylornithine carbamoyltransferase